MTTTAPDRETTATRLLRVSAEHSHDPLVEIDWDAEPVPGAYYVNPARTSLYGTELWESLTEDQRIELTKHEVASVASVGIWFELVLMEMLVRHAYERDPRTAHVKYALTAIADECRHSIMFATMIERFGAPAYGPGRLAHVLARGFAKRSRGPLIFAAALYVEEVLDTFQREMIRDETIQPLSTAVARIHVVEEARHIQYARAELARNFDNLSPFEKVYTRLLFAIASAVATRRLIHPNVYAAVGLDPKAAARAARRNPNWRETRRWAASKIVSFASEIGLIAGPAKFIWKLIGVLPENSPAEAVGASAA